MFKNTESFPENSGIPKDLFELKAKLLCEGANVDDEALQLFESQNPSRVKRGGLSSGGKIQLSDDLFVNFPFYKKRLTDLQVLRDPEKELGLLIKQADALIAKGSVIKAPDWYRERVGGFDITQIITAHNKQLATSVYESCDLFRTRNQCKFCVINTSLKDKNPNLIEKSPTLMLEALSKIPVAEYGGLTINGGMTVNPGRGMELIEPVVKAVRESYPELPIAVEITPPEDLEWIDRLAAAGTNSLMMNLECWDNDVRKKIIPGKNKYCPRDLYLAALQRAVKVLGPGRVSSCFVVGGEPIDSLKQGIKAVIAQGAIPSPLAGRYFEEVPNYRFKPNASWREFLEIQNFTKAELQKNGLCSTDQAGCVACKMCDMIKDLTRSGVIKSLLN